MTHQFVREPVSHFIQPEAPMGQKKRAQAFFDTGIDGFGIDLHLPSLVATLPQRRFEELPGRLNAHQRLRLWRRCLFFMLSSFLSLFRIRWEFERTIKTLVK